jgi:hypothetical protein
MFYYAYAFFIGNVLIADNAINSNTGEPYNPGEIFACLLAILYGIYSLGIAAPNIKAIVEG